MCFSALAELIYELYIILSGHAAPTAARAAAGGVLRWTEDAILITVLAMHELPPVGSYRLCHKLLDFVYIFGICHCSGLHSLSIPRLGIRSFALIAIQKERL